MAAWGTGLATSFSPDLPARLRLETRDLHAATERTGAMAALLGGRLARPAYCTMLRNLHALYAALEAALRERQHDAAIAPLQSQALQREPALSADLRALHGPRWATELTLQAATAHYVQRLQTLAQNGAPALVAHAYVRYLGDLHGGQILKRLVARGVGLPEDAQGRTAGTQFYEFGDQAQVLRLRQQLRHALGVLPVSVAEQDLIVAEARWAFVQHQRLFEQLPA